MKLRVAKLALAAAAFALLAGGVTARAADMHQTNIIDTAKSAGQFNTLIKAVDAAGLTETLMGPGPYTVFAPTDAAFAKLPPGTLESLLKPENKDELKAILTYHVVPGTVTAADLVKLNDVKTLNGKMLHVHQDGDAVMINDAKVISADIAASNGVIHAIDSVVLPPKD